MIAKLLLFSNNRKNSMEKLDHGDGSADPGKSHFSNLANRDVMSSIYEHFMPSLRKES